jgi:3-methyladenine DNA glycosylase AlkD
VTAWANSVSDAFDQRITAFVVPGRAENEKQYLKSDMDHLGVAVPDVRKVISTLIRESPPDGHDAIIELVSVLWDEPRDPAVFQRRLAAGIVLTRHKKDLVADDLPLLERLLRECHTWALMDEIVPRSATDLADTYPDVDAAVAAWADDDDFWMRRASLLRHLKPLAAGDGDFEAFSTIADSMLGDDEFFIRKAIGWVLRETSKKRPELVADWVRPRATRMSGLTFRESTRRLPDELQVELKALRS